MKSQSPRYIRNLSGEHYSVSLGDSCAPKQIDRLVREGAEQVYMAVAEVLDLPSIQEAVYHSTDLGDRGFKRGDVKVTINFNKGHIHHVCVSRPSKSVLKALSTQSTWVAFE